jgi:hypothetical protein
MPNLSKVTCEKPTIASIPCTFVLVYLITYQKHFSTMSRQSEEQLLELMLWSFERPSSALHGFKNQSYLDVVISKYSHVTEKRIR